MNFEIDIVKMLQTLKQDNESSNIVSSLKSHIKNNYAGVFLAPDHRLFLIDFFAPALGKKTKTRKYEGNNTNAAFVCETTLAHEVKESIKDVVLSVSKFKKFNDAFNSSERILIIDFFGLGGSIANHHKEKSPWEIFLDRNLAFSVDKSVNIAFVSSDRSLLFYSYDQLNYLKQDNNPTISSGVGSISVHKMYQWAKKAQDENKSIDDIARSSWLLNASRYIQGSYKGAFVTDQDGVFAKNINLSTSMSGDCDKVDVENIAILKDYMFVDKESSFDSISVDVVDPMESILFLLIVDRDIYQGYQPTVPSCWIGRVCDERYETLFERKYLDCAFDNDKMKLIKSIGNAIPFIPRPKKSHTSPDAGYNDAVEQMKDKIGFVVKVIEDLDVASDDFNSWKDANLPKVVRLDNVVFYYFSMESPPVGMRIQMRLSNTAISSVR